MHYITGFIVQVLIVCFLIIVGFFVAANGQNVPFNLPLFNATYMPPLWLPVLLAFMVGFFLAFAIGSVGTLFLKWSLHRTEKKLAKEHNKLEEEREKHPPHQQPAAKLTDQSTDQ